MSQTPREIVRQMLTEIVDEVLGPPLECGPALSIVRAERGRVEPDQLAAVQRNEGAVAPKHDEE